MKVNYFKIHKNKKPKKAKYSSFYTKIQKQNLKKMHKVFIEKTELLNQKIKNL